MKRLSVKITSLAEMQAALANGPAIEYLHYSSTGNLAGENMQRAQHHFGEMSEENFWQHREYLRDTGLIRETRREFDLVGLMYDIGVIGCDVTASYREAWRDKFIHHSVTSGKVAYTENPEKGKRDIQLATTIGRLAKKLIPELTDEQVKKISSEYHLRYGDVEVIYGETEEEFIEGIKNGPTESCMATITPAGHKHPAAAYASGDMIIATIKPGGDRVTARTIINKSTKEFSRIYGDIPRIKGRLEAAGFTQKVGALAGCRLLKITNENGRGWLMPYVDAGIGSGGGSLRFCDDGDYWMLAKSGGADTYAGYAQRGVATSCEPDDDDDEGGDGSVECVCCNDCYDSGDMRYIEDAGGDVCDGCVDEYYRHAITGLWGGGNYYHEYLHRDSCTYVECMDEWVADNVIDDIGLVLDSGSGDYIHEEDAVTCVADEETYHREDCVKVGTDNEGVVLYLYDSRRSLERHADELYRCTDATTKDISNGLRLFWDESEEIVTWQENEDRDEWKYIRLDRWDEYVGSLHYRPVVEEVLPAPVPVPLPHTPSQFSEALNQLLDTPNVEPVWAQGMSWVEYYRSLQNARIEMECLQDGGVWERGWWQFSDGQSGYRRADGVTLPTGPEVTPTPVLQMPEDLTWRQQCAALQREGVKFERNEGGVFVHDSICYAFNMEKAKYRRVDRGPMPSDMSWKTQALRMQCEGYIFSYTSWNGAISYHKALPVPAPPEFYIQCVADLAFSEDRGRYAVVAAPYEAPVVS